MAEATSSAKPPANATHPLSRAAWRAWLRAPHRRTAGVWLISYKKATGKPRFEYGEAVEEALCFGWIDSKPPKLDAERSMLWFAPRKAGTGWSKTRARRIDETARLAARGERANQWKGPRGESPSPA